MTLSEAQAIHNDPYNKITVTLPDGTTKRAEISTLIAAANQEDNGDGLVPYYRDLCEQNGIEWRKPEPKDDVTVGDVLRSLSREARDRRIANGLEKPLASFGDRGRLRGPFDDTEY